ncbi:MAG: hypothetical protein KKE39_03355, partial [Bacteroidetes bacterium]|nr:hypothetical protein [Bacteroidota bacterium]MBU1760583.1 hypothetical protein [Bacteroidota bacterium]
QDVIHSKNNTGLQNLSIAGFSYHQFKSDSGISYEPYISKLLKIDELGNFSYTKVDSKSMTNYRCKVSISELNSLADTLFDRNNDKSLGSLKDIFRSDQFIVEAKFDDHVERTEVSLRSIKQQIVLKLIDQFVAKMQEDSPVELAKSEKNYWLTLFNHSSLIKLSEQKLKIDPKMQLKIESDKAL